MTRSNLTAVAVAALVLASSALAANFLLTKTGETSSTITFSYPAQNGVDGWRYYAPGTVSGDACSGTRVARSFDLTKLGVRFAKVAAGTYCVEAIQFVPVGAGQYPAETPPLPGPTATFTISPSSAVVGQTVTFDWTGTCAAGGCTVVWEDEGPDGPGGTEFPWGTTDPLVRSFTATGTKYAHLVVTDSLDRIAESRQQLVVTADPPPPPPPPPPGTCDLNATPANFAAQLVAIAPGQTLCLASGDYGTWTGTGKTITVAAAPGASPQMRFSFGSGDTGFVLSGMTGMGGDINGSSNVTIRNSTFTSTLNIGGSGTDGIVLDGNTHNWNVGPSSGGPNAKIYLENSLTGTLGSPSVTIKNSQISNGDLDGVHFGGGSGYLILNNEFSNLCDQGANHTDNMQFDTSPTTNVRIVGNYVHAEYSCGTQGITSYDHGTRGNVIIENNVVDIHRPWGIELYSDVGTIVRHNTVVYYPASNCYFNTPCGRIGIDRKSADPAGTGTEVYDNLATVEFANGSTGTAHHNVSGNGALFVGPLTSHDGFLLASASPVGRGAASDGTDVGVYPN